MMIDREKLLELESEYEIGFSEILKYYTALKSIPCVERGSEENFSDCLETLIQDRISNSFKKEQMLNNRFDEKNIMFTQKSLEYSISDALYRIYDEDAIPYLTEEYKQERQLESAAVL